HLRHHNGLRVMMDHRGHETDIGRGVRPASAVGTCLGFRALGAGDERGAPRLRAAAAAGDKRKEHGDERKAGPGHESRIRRGRLSMQDNTGRARVSTPANVENVGDSFLTCAASDEIANEPRVEYAACAYNSFGVRPCGVPSQNAAHGSTSTMS